MALRTIQSAKDAGNLSARGRKFLLVGEAGSGKTSQFLTFPGKKFAYLFDPNAIHSIADHDVDFLEFMPDIVSMDVRFKRGDTTLGQAVTQSKEDASKVYVSWEQDFEERLRTGFFDEYDSIMFDSLSTFSEMVMDYVLKLVGRAGQAPQQDDYGPQMAAIRNVFRTVTSMGKNVLVTAHQELLKDDVSGRIQHQILVTGKLRKRLPALFSEIYACESEPEKGRQKYTIQTRPDSRNPAIRSAIKGLEFKEDVTIDWSKPVAGKQGLGGIIARLYGESALTADSSEKGEAAPEKEATAATATS